MSGGAHRHPRQRRGSRSASGAGSCLQAKKCGERGGVGREKVRAGRKNNRRREERRGEEKRGEERRREEKREKGE